ncbi:hypothetical protein PBAL39_06401 [Pedobacter sp. BAL39]|uniref:hypothetical protein n=1 Tax=Pedobacter sp. BAL39 TaxID=391596 RepID=UPI0001559A2A|nr:hypothetical protein [Pedobacter sp. BAL39]EDM35788.1 hypothetical protein PBAL39_06401 [Pedobacter sp. BAL39]
MNVRLVVLLLLLFAGLRGVSQSDVDCKVLLDQQPYFVKHKSDEKDLALKRDIEILKHCGNFDSVDSAFLKGPMLGVIMLQEVRAGKPATYRTIVDFFNNFRKTAEYKDFAYGLSLYRKIGQKKVRLEDWKVDQELFVRMGFTVNDLEDFKHFLEAPAQQGATYLQAFSRYMAELEGMRVDKDK